MNKYSVTITENGKAKVKEIFATSISDCKERLVRWIYDHWDYDFTTEDYDDLKEELRDYGIIISYIEEVEC